MYVTIKKSRKYMEKDELENQKSTKPMRKNPFNGIRGK